MNYHNLGTTSLRISTLGYGCMSLLPDDPQAESLLLHALDSGINFFDTADLYNHGENEALLGRAFKSCRSQVIIATKVGNRWRPDGSGWDWAPTKAYMLKAADESLRRLQTHYIDLYQLHGGTLEDPIDEIMEAFELLRQAGKIRYYGISSIRPNVIRRWCARGGLSSLMMQYSLLDRRPEESAMPLIREHGLGMLARGSLAQGLLVGKPAKAYLTHSPEQVQAVQQAIQQLTSPERDAAAVALQFVWAQPAVTAAVVGMRTMAQLQDALKAASAPALSEAELQTLRQAAPAGRYQEHR